MLLALPAAQIFIRLLTGARVANCPWANKEIVDSFLSCLAPTLPSANCKNDALLCRVFCQLNRKIRDEGKKEEQSGKERAEKSEAGAILKTYSIPLMLLQEFKVSNI